MTYANMGSNYIKLKEFGKAIDIMKLELNFLGNNYTYADSVLLLNLAVASNKKGDFENGLLNANEVLNISENSEILDYAQKTKIESMENLGMTINESS